GAECAAMNSPTIFDQESITSVSCNRSFSPSFCARNPGRPRAHRIRAVRCECDQSRQLEFWREAHRTASTNSHRPEQRTPGSVNLLGHKRHHNLLEARVAAQLVPVWGQA